MTSKGTTRLTTASVENVALPNPGRIEHFIRDDKVEGFALRVTARGVKSFVFEGRIKGRVRRITLGRYPDLTVFLARQKALEKKAAIARGEDPYEERRAGRREATLGQLVDDWLQNYAVPRRRSWKRGEARLKKHLWKSLF